MFTNATRGWPVEGLTLEKLRQKFGTEQFRTRVGGYGKTDEIKGNNPNQLAPQGRKYDTYSIADFLDVAENKKAAPEGGVAYMGKATLSDSFVERMGVQLPPFFPKSAFTKPNMWLGPPNSATPLHMDGRDNFIIQLIGHKHFILFSHADRPYLYTGGTNWWVDRCLNN